MHGCTSRVPPFMGATLRNHSLLLSEVSFMGATYTLPHLFIIGTTYHNVTFSARVSLVPHNWQVPNWRELLLSLQDCHDVIRGHPISDQIPRTLGPAPIWSR